MRPLPLGGVLAVSLALLIVVACQDTERVTQPTLEVVATRNLTVSGSGTGNGVVTSTPSGINCTVTAGTAASSGCTKAFTQGTKVTLKASPAGGHAFGGWLNSTVCSGTGDCVLTLTVDRAVTALFRKGPFTIRISSGTSGVGSGRVQSQSGLTPVINCVITNGTPATTGCSATYPANTKLTLTATAATGFVFAGWKAASCGTGSCLFKIIQSQTIPVTFSPVILGSPAVEGRWEPAFSTTPIVGVHAHMLRTGKVLFWGDSLGAYLWTPGGSFTPVAPKPFRIYCTGHTFLSDGRLLVMGGTSPATRGLRFATIFDPATNSWSTAPSMLQGRYYPTATALPNGDVLVVSGHDTALKVVKSPETFSKSGWRQLTKDTLSIDDPFYPDMFVAPNGDVFLAGFPGTTRYLNVSGGGWTTVADRKVADRRMGSAVMYAPGKILYAGGGGAGVNAKTTDQPPTASAEVIDLNQASPAWRLVASMQYARRQMNATLLADGSVLVTGGTSGAHFNDQAGAVHFAERWDPKTETWTTMAREPQVRTYHSTALLLQSGRVLSSGSGEGGGIIYANSEFTGQVFSPPYLFNPDGSPAMQPRITSAPTKISYKQSFTVQSPDAGSVSRGTLIRLGSVTHAFNQSQLIYHLTFTAAGTTLTAVAPDNGNLAPPGPYMLFLINGSGVPSVARMVTIGP